MSSTGAVPLAVRVRFAHAAAQHVADRLGIAVLHVKGPALSAGIVAARGEGSDADLWARPKDAALLRRSLLAHGWREITGFDTGSPFGHAATLRHTDFGYADLHRHFPGLESRNAFDVLWERRVVREIAGRPCACLDPVAERLILLVHAARAGGLAADDVRLAWLDRTAPEQDDVTRLADELRAHVALAAALGHLEDHRTDPAYALWRQQSTGAGDRLDEWLARLQAAAGITAKARLVLHALRPNAGHEELRRGHPLSRGERRRLWVRRYQRLTTELRQRWRR